MLTYEQTIKILGEQSFHLYMGGNMSYRPDGIRIVGEIYDVPSSKVEADIGAYRLALINEQVAKHQRSTT